MSLGVKRKGPSEVINFAVDWSDWLDTDRDGTVDDTISTSSWAVDDGLTAGTDSTTTTVATLQVSGGTIGETYKLTNTIVTAGGETFVRYGTVHLVDR